MPAITRLLFLLLMFISNVTGFFLDFRGTHPDAKVSLPYLVPPALLLCRCVELQTSLKCDYVMHSKHNQI